MALKDYRFSGGSNISSVNPSQLIGKGGDTINSGFKQLSDLGKTMNQKRIQGEMTSVVGKYAGEDMANPATQKLLMGDLAQVKGASIEDVRKASNVLFGRLDADRTYEKGQYGFTTDELGNAYSYNKNTGAYEKVGNSPYAGGVNPKNIVLKPITNRDGYGNETTTQVPFDKTTGQPINTQPSQNGDVLSAVAESDLLDYLATEYNITSVEQFNALPIEQQQQIRNSAVEAFQPPVAGVSAPENIGVGVKAPTLSQADRDAAGATSKAIDLISDIDKQFSNSIVGPIDNAMSWGINKLGINNDRVARNRTLNATLQNLKANLTAALIKGVPSDKDMKVIEDMLPATEDSEDVFQSKLDNIKKILSSQSQITKDNILNPRQQGGITGTTEKRKVKLNNSVDAIDNGDGTFTLSDGTVVRKQSHGN